MNASNELPMNVAQVRQEERKAFAKLLHDDLAQEIMAAAMLTEVLRRRLVSEENPLASEAIHLTQIMTKMSERLQSIVQSLDSIP